MWMEEWQERLPKWNDFAQRYDGIFMQEPLYRETLELIVEQLEDVGDGSVLELGCGTGNLISSVLEKYPSARVVGVDPSEGMRLVCERKFAGNAGVEIAKGDALAIPGPDGRFDYVLSNYALHHVPPGQRGECAAELARVLRPGGELAYSDPFCCVDAPPHDPARIRDILESSVAQALHDFEQGACEMMKIKLSTMVKTVFSEGEFLTTPEVWAAHLEGASFTEIRVIEVPPTELGMRIIRAVRI
jgi:ubiquinone/menaquinone biosynthesis C-methylase UbiE